MPSTLPLANPRVGGRREGNTRAGRTGHGPRDSGSARGVPSPTVRQPLPASRGLELHHLEKLEADSRLVTRRMAGGREMRPEPTGLPAPSSREESRSAPWGQPWGSTPPPRASCPGDTELQGAGYAVADLQGFQSKPRCHQIWKRFPRDKPAFDMPSSLHSHTFQRFLF